MQINKIQIKYANMCMQVYTHSNELYIPPEMIIEV